MTIAEIFEKQRKFFYDNKSKPVVFRKNLLERLKEVLKQNEDKLNEAIYKDLRKCTFETYDTELGIVYNEINNAIKNINKWSRTRRMHTNLLNFPGSSYKIPEPYGNSLIIGAWNLPYNLTFTPTISSLAAGNTVILKPSELAKYSSKAIADIINSNFQPEILYVFEGGVEETTTLLLNKFDKIFFTGSPNVGKIVMEAAAKNLTSITLELGGKNPCIVMPDADLKVTAKRIAWGKFLNAGQMCIAPDYLLIHSSVKEQFLKLLIDNIEKIHGKDPIHSEALIRIINIKHFNRIVSLIEKDKIYYGGHTKEEDLYISPTILHNITFKDKVMEDEIFGPILPVIEFTDIDLIIKEIRSRPSPLSFYLFTFDKKIQKKIIENISFGGGCINDTIMQASNPNLPFGGVGFSGIGAYHSKAGFDEFTHYKSILKKPAWFEPFIKYPPYNKFKKNLLKLFLEG